MASIILFVVVSCNNDIEQRKLEYKRIVCENYTTKWTNSYRVGFDEGGNIYDHEKIHKMIPGETCAWEYKTIEVDDEQIN